MKISITILVLLFILYAIPVAASDVLIVEGMAPITDNDFASARNTAIQSGLRDAVGQVVGTMVDSYTNIKNYQLVEDRIILKAQGYVSNYEILKTWISDNCYYVQLSVTVEDSRIAQTLAEIQKLIEPVKPRVIVLIPENHLGQPSTLSYTETEIMEILLQAGFSVLDQKGSEEARSTELIRRSLAGEKEALLQLNAMYKTDFFVIGETTTEIIGMLADFYSCEAHCSIRVIHSATAEMIYAHTENEVAKHLTENAASKEAAQIVGVKMGKHLLSVIPTKVAKPMIQVNITGVTFEEVQKIDQYLQTLNQIDNVYIRDFLKDSVKIDIITNLTVMQLNRVLSECNIITFKTLAVSSNKLDLTCSE